MAVSPSGRQWEKHKFVWFYSSQQLPARGELQGVLQRPNGPLRMNWVFALGAWKRLVFGFSFGVFCLTFCSENSIKEMKLRVYPTCAILIICVRNLTTALFSQGKELRERSHEVPATTMSGSPYRHLYFFSVVQELYIHFGERNLRVAEMYQIRFVLFRYMRLLC